MVYMYEYTWYQWLTFFFIYCFFGWIFESTYVSAKTGHFVNRGFLRLPLLPLYGTGAVMMLWVSLPVKDNLFLVYLAGVIAATILEYVTGWGMEKLFKMKFFWLFIILMIYPALASNCCSTLKKEGIGSSENAAVPGFGRRRRWGFHCPAA